MYNVVILGAGGLGREVYEVFEDTYQNHPDYKFKGFLSDVLNIFDDFEGYPPLLGTIKDYEVQPNDRFLLAIGDVKGRRKVAESILERGGEFMSLIHPKAKIFRTAKIGKGVIIFPFAYVGADAHVGDYCFINLWAACAHDAVLGQFSELAPYSALSGGASAGEECFLCIHSIVAPKTHIGSRVIISQGSATSQTQADDSFVIGVPGETFKRRSAVSNTENEV